MQANLIAICVLLIIKKAKYTIFRGEFYMDEKFVVKPKTTRSVTMTIRIDKELNDKLEQLALKSNRSRNELINMSLKYAFDNLKFIDNKKE